MFGTTFKRIVATVLALCIGIAALPLTTAAEDIAAPADGNFNFLWVTDPQIYTSKYQHILSAQNDWIIANANRLKVKYAFNTGDLVHVCSDTSQWEYISKEYKKWDDAGFSYGVLAGNHDLNGSDHSTYSQYFGASRYNNKEKNWWYGGDYKDNYGHYDIRSTGGADFVFVYLSYGDHSQEDLAWVNSVLAQHSNRIAVLAVHDYMATGGGRTERGELLFNEVVLKNPNVRMVLCGHNYNSNRAVDEIDDNGDGKADRTVYQIMANYQYASNGGNGCIRFMECDVKNGTITHRTYSPYTQSFGSDYEDGQIYDEFGYRDYFVTPFDFSNPTPKADGDPISGTVVYSSDISLAQTETLDRVTMPVVYQNQAETGAVYRGIGVYDRFFSLDAADAFSDPTALNYVITEFKQATGHIVKKVVKGASLSNAAVRVPIPQNGAVIVLPADAAVSLDAFSIGRRVTLDKMHELTTPSSMYATTLAVPAWGSVYNLHGVNRAPGNGEWVLYDSLNTSVQPHTRDMLFTFAPVGSNTYTLTACDTAIGTAKSPQIPAGGFVLAVNTSYAKTTLVEALRSRFRVGVTVTLNGHTVGVAPQYTTKSLLAPSVGSYSRENTMTIKADGSSHIFYNTDGLYPRADYTYPSGIKVDPSSMVLHYDYLLEKGLKTHICLYFDNGSVTIHPYFEGGDVDAKSGDLEGDDVRRIGKIDIGAMNIPAACFNADGTLTLNKIRIYASGTANKKLYLHTLALTTDRSPVGDAVTPQSVPLLGSDITVKTPANVGGYVYDNGKLTVTSDTDDGYELLVTLNERYDVTVLKNLLLDVDATVRFDIRPVFTTAKNDASYGLVSDLWPLLCEELDGNYIPAGRYAQAVDLLGCFTWNKVVPADGITTVKTVRIVLGGKGTLTLNTLQATNTDQSGRFEDGVYQAVVTPTTLLESDVYTVGEQYIEGVSSETTVGELLSHLVSYGKIIVCENGAAVAEDALVKTGMTVTVSGETAVWSLVIKGDVDGDGAVNTWDVRLVLLNCLHAADLSDAYAAAADYNHSGTINTTDARAILDAVCN